MFGSVDSSERMRSALIAGAVATVLALPSADGVSRTWPPFAAPTGLASSATTVDCSAGGKVQTAINSAVAGDIIVVQGTCVENVSIPDEAVRFTLDGLGSGTIHGPTGVASFGRFLPVNS